MVAHAVCATAGGCIEAKRVDCVGDHVAGPRFIPATPKPARQSKAKEIPAGDAPQSERKLPEKMTPGREFSHGRRL